MSLTITISPPLPPSPAVASYSHASDDSSTSAAVSSSPSIPPTFVDAMTVRHAVFVREQGVPADFELDADDPRCWHWVAYATVTGTATEGVVVEGETTPKRTPVGTLRLVPPPHPPHPAVQGRYVDGKLVGTGPPPEVDATGVMGGTDGTVGITEPSASSSVGGTAVDGPAAATEMAQEGVGNGDATLGAADRPTSLHDGREPYVKLGRLAVLPAYRRRHGIARMLVRAALEWLAATGPTLAAGEGDTGDGHGGHNGTRWEGWKGLVCVHAQSQVEGWWAREGFVLDEAMGTWWEEGMRHVGMFQRIELKGPSS